MCWSEEVSFATFGVGTALNILIAWILVRRRALTPAILILGWQYGLLMQPVEGVAWARIHGGGDALVGPSRAAMILNVTQPFAMFAAVRATRPPPRHGAVAVVLYALFLIGDAPALLADARDVTPDAGCATLDLRWWTPPRTLLYLGTSAIVLAEIESRLWCAANLAIFFASLAVALHSLPCGVGSLWCWIIAAASPVLLAVDTCARWRANHTSSS